jgi:hypothetical protein
MANMIKFYRGLAGSLPATGENGALYITTDEGAIYYGTGTGMKRLGDFVQVDAIANLPADGANTSALYYCVAENVLAKWNGESWTQVNKQPTADELKTLLSLGDLAYLDEVAEENLTDELATKINNKVDQVPGKSLVDDTEITKLSGVSEGANKVENVGEGKIKIDGQEVTVYAHPEKHAIADVDDLQDALDGLQAKGDYAAEEHTHTKDEITDFAHTHTKSEITDFAHTHVSADITDLDDTIKGYVGVIPETAEATDLVAYIQEKTAGIATDAALEELTGRVADAENAITAINNEATGVLAQAKAYVDSEDVFHTDITTVNALGGIAAGADLDGMTTHEILNTLLFPYVAFVLGSTSRSAAAATLENGASQTLNSASISITKKSKPITSVKLLNGSTVLGEKTGDEVAAGGTITFSNLGITVSKSNNPNLKFTVTDCTTSTDKNVGASTFVYPYYTGECAADATIDETLIEGLTKKVESKGNKTVTHTCENGRMVIAYPKAHGVLKSILDPNNFETIGDYTRSEVSVTGLDGTAQTYYVYASGAATVSGFKVQYKY